MWIVGIIFIAYYIITISILLRRIVNCLQIVYYPFTNMTYIIILFLIASGFCCNLKNFATSKANYIILPLLLGSLVVAFVGNIKNFDLNAIYPILGNGASVTFFSGITNMFAFSGIAYLYFLPSKMKEPHRFNKIAFISILISSLFLIISVAIVLFTFSNTIIDSEIFPLYTAVRYIEFGSFFQRLDAVFLLIWVLSFISLLCIVVNLCIHIFKKLTNLSDKNPIIYPILLCIFGISMLIKDNSLLETLERNLYSILFFTVIIGLACSILIFANIKKRIKNKEISNE